MKRLCLSALIILLPILVAFAPHDSDAPDSANYAAPVGIGGDGPYDAHNIEILGHLPLGQMGGGPANILANDCWGWTDSQTGREYAICGLMHATAFVDITDPTNPSYLGRLMTHTGVSTWRDMKVYNDHVFVVADLNGGHGMQVFDLTMLRTADSENPQDFPAATVYTGSVDAHNLAINEDTGFAYILGSSGGGGLHAVNIQDPVNPVEAGAFQDDGWTHDAVVVSYSGPDTDYEGQEIAFACNVDSLTIVDVTDKSNMTQVARKEYVESGYTHQCWITEDHRYIYLGDEFDERDYGGSTRVIVFDCQDLDNPVYLGYYSGATNAIDHNLYIRDDKVFLSNYSAGMRVLQIDPEDPLNLTEIGYVDTYMADNDTDYDGVWSNYPFFESGNIIISDRQHGLFVVRMAELNFDYPDGRPQVIDPNGEAEFTVDVSAGIGGNPLPATGMLHVDRGNGFETFPMNEVSSNQYEAVFPVTDCGSVIRYYVSATSDNDVVVRNPIDAPATTFSAISADFTSTTFADNFETDQGWQVSGDAAEGHWERGIPAGNGGRGDPTVDADGSGSCYLTFNSPENSDVDDGTTILTSPTLDAVGDGTAVAAFLNYHRWFYNAIGNEPGTDEMLIEISNDAGETWTEIETVGPNGNEVSGGWFYRSRRISDFVDPTSEIQVRFSASDLGDGSIVEAAVDGVEILLIHCDDEIVLGDVNQDGVVNLLDVAPFVDLVSTGGYLPEADINMDGFVNLLDVQPFVALLAD